MGGTIMNAIRKLGLSIAAGMLVAVLATPASAERVWTRVPYGGGTIVVRIEVAPGALVQPQPLISNYYQPTPIQPNLGLQNTGFRGTAFSGVTFSGVNVVGDRFMGSSWRGVWNAGQRPY
jgi:hypothetical protein